MIKKWSSIILSILFVGVISLIFPANAAGERLEVTVHPELFSESGDVYSKCAEFLFEFNGWDESKHTQVLDIGNMVISAFKKTLCDAIPEWFEPANHEEFFNCVSDCWRDVLKEGFVGKPLTLEMVFEAETESIAMSDTESLKDLSVNVLINGNRVGSYQRPPLRLCVPFDCTDAEVWYEFESYSQEICERFYKACNREIFGYSHKESEKNNSSFAYVW